MIESTREIDLRRDDIIELLANALSNSGFTVLRSVTLNDINGIKHSIDLLAEGEVSIGVPIKIAFLIHHRVLSVHDTEWFISKRYVMPFIDKFVIVTTASAELEASRILRRYGMHVVTLDEVIRELKSLSKVEGMGYKLPKFIVKPKFSCLDAVEVMKKEAKPRFFGRRKCVNEEFTLVYIPLIRVEAKLTVKEPSTENVYIKDVVITIDGIKGYVMRFDRGSPSIDEVLGIIADIPSKTLDVLSIIAREGIAQLNEIAAQLGEDESRIRSILDALSTKSLIDVYGDIAEVRYRTFEDLGDIFDVISKDTVTRVSNDQLRMSAGGVLLPIKTPVYKLVDLVRSLNGEIVTASVIYYPLYIAICRENSHEERVLVYDAITGEHHEELARIIDQPDILRLISRYLRPVDRESCAEA